ncbi:MAG: tRNA (guanosine(37)-N1)-methyltransferase TrmD [Magnetococcales bacterium]|nr:tRNA (guanosine(37)-N1)-methyltransferase TrmD [Magnetococcales bacterium]
MDVSLLTLFPEMFDGFLASSIIRRAQESARVSIRRYNIRDHADGPHRQVDDSPFGGGPGMVMKADVLAKALQKAKGERSAHVVYLSPQGPRFDQTSAKRLAREAHLILVCGHYEGVDERFIHRYVDEEISLGDFVLTGGEIPAMAVVDAVIRLLPGVLGNAESAPEDSFYNGLLDHPHYTRPAVLSDANRKMETAVPDVLRSGNHAAIADWRRRQALLRTLIRRPDLIDGAPLSKAEQRLITTLRQELESIESEKEQGISHGAL